MTITEFLTARLDEDEAVANEATANPRHGVATADEMEFSADDADNGDGWVVTHGMRLLVEVEAKRRIVTTYAAHEDEPMSSDAGFHNCGDSCVYSAMDWTLKVLALPYADHEQFQEEWRV